jgi:polar amino acid transport system substrate-binding protein
MSKFLTRSIGLAALCSLVFATAAANAQAVPKPGESPRIDAIKQRGSLRVGVVANPPWLMESTSGSGEPWRGPAWTLAKKYAQLLGVKLEAIPVSQETTIPVLAADKVDISIAPMAPTPARAKVVDFVNYSTNAMCLFGLASNPKIKDVKTIDELNRPDITIAYFTGSADGPFVKGRFPKAEARGVSTAGIAPVEEVTARRSDLAAIPRLSWIVLSRKVKGLMVFPRENNCQDSKEAASPTGMAIHIGQTVFFEWMKAVAKPMLPELKAEEERLMADGA